MSDLVVGLYGTRIGSLTGRGPALDFAADPEAVDEFGLDSLVLSVAVPLAVVPARARRARRHLDRRVRRCARTGRRTLRP